MHVERPLSSLINLTVRRAPVEVQLVVTRRCNLSCGYCHESDRTSAEVPLATLKRRIDAIHRLHATSIAMLGGEPLLHPDIAELVGCAHRNSQVSLTTNGILVTPEVVKKLNGAGLSTLQISIDALTTSPNGYIQKSLDRLKTKLDILCDLAAFATHATVVLCPESLGEFPKLLQDLRQYPIRVSVNLVHNAQGAAVVNGARYLEAWREHFRSSRVFTRFEEQYGASLLNGRPQDWHCRAGERSLYVDEHGEVHYCASQRGRVGCNIETYNVESARRHGVLRKGCESGCSVFCVYRASLVDNRPLYAVAQLVRTGLSE